MKTALALRHVHFEDVGHLGPALERRGYQVRHLDATLAPLDAVDADADDLLIVLGGPIGAYDETLYPFLGPEIDLVRRRLASGRPLLGICLGAQLIARALGADVYPMGVKEIGFAPLTLTPAGALSPLAAIGNVQVLHWHGDQFDIPEGMSHFASTGIGAHQAFGNGRGVLGLQFHFETDTRFIEHWLVGHAAELAAAGVDPGRIREDAAVFGPSLEFAAEKLLDAWFGELARVSAP